MAELGLAALPGTWSSAFSISSHSPYDKDFISPKTPRGYILLLTPLHRGGERGSEKDRELAQSHITRKQRSETQLLTHRKWGSTGVRGEPELSQTCT